MLCDLTDTSAKSERDIGSGEFRPFQDEGMRIADFWGEHCVECGAPFCYSSCDKFSATRTGRCRRFANGITPALIDNATVGCCVHFLPWGKMELHSHGFFVTQGNERLIRSIDKAAGLFFRGIRCIFPYAICGRDTISLQNSLRVRLAKWFGKRGDPAVWHIWCQSRTQEVLRYAILDADEHALQEGELSIHAGDNRTSVDVLEAGAAYFRIYSLDGTTGDLCLSMEIVSSKGIASQAKFVKCVVWDLDNTVWDGILANDGEESLRLRTHVVEVIKILDKRGILNTICSKNDFEVAWNALKKFGIEQYFVFPEINWKAKSENIKRIARRMNLGINAFAFIDDSKHERGEVFDNLPMIRVYSDTEVQSLPTLPPFNPPVSEESGKRRHFYLAEMARKQDEEADVGSHEEFVRKCHIKLECFRPHDEATRRRCWELVNRTNQLTLAAHRYTEDEFQILTAKQETFAVKCCDKYGDYGIVGFVAMHVAGDTCELSEFVMSCRVAKKFCERSVLLTLAMIKKRQGCSRFLAHLVRTSRNGALIEEFNAMPFVRQEHDDGTDYLLDLTTLGESARVSGVRNEVKVEEAR